MSHVLSGQIGPDMCKILPALHKRTGGDFTSTVGTQFSALKAKPTCFLLNFGRRAHDIDITLAEEYLVQVLQSGAPFKMMDGLQYYKYYHTKDMTCN